MKITPIEIRQHTFEKGLRGYKTEDVDAFLLSLSQEWERVTGDYKMLKMQLELAEKELGKLKEVEMTLFRTLKTAEDTSTQITDQANKAAETYLNEAKQKADEILADARKRSALMVQDAENQARYLKDNLLNDLKSLEHDFKALESYKDNLATQIRALAGNAVDSVERFEKKFAKQSLKTKIEEVSEQIKSEAKATEEPSQPVAEPQPVTQHQGQAAELPPLEERETAVPEAIPVDADVVAKLDEAIEHANEPVATEQATVETAAVEQTKAVAEPVAEITAATTPDSSPKKSGSFFDQI